MLAVIIGIIGIIVFGYCYLGSRKRFYMLLTNGQEETELQVINRLMLQADRLQLSIKRAQKMYPNINADKIQRLRLLK